MRENRHIGAISSFQEYRVWPSVPRAVSNFRRDDDDQSDIICAKSLGQIGGFLETPPEPVHAIDDKCIDWAAGNKPPESCERGAVKRGTRITVIVETLGDKTPPQLTHRLNVSGAGPILDLTGREIIIR